MKEDPNSERHPEPTCPFELVRAELEGTLSADEHAWLERRLAQDDELRAFADDYRGIHSLTEESAQPLRSHTSFAALERRIELESRTRPWQHVAAAAAVFVVASVGVIAWKAFGGSLGEPFGSSAPAGPLYLTDVDLRPVPAVLPQPPPLEGLADYDPRDLDGDVDWMLDPETAYWLAGLAERPLIVYGAFDGCPMAAALDREVFAQADVVSLFERFVPLRIRLDDLPPEEANAMMARGYPFLEVWTPELKPVHSLSRAPIPANFVESMHQGLDAAEATGDLPSWDDLRGLLELFEKARAAEAVGDMASAETSYLLLANGPGEFSLVAEDGLKRLAADVRTGFLEVRERAMTDVTTAREQLDELVLRYEGTRFSADLEGLRERLIAEGRFPEVVSAP